MIRLILLLLSSFLLASTSFAICGEEQFKKCLKESKLQGKPSAECQLLSDYLQNKPMHWQEDQWFSPQEWKIRQELKAKGLDLDYAVPPTDYLYTTVGKKEIIAVTTAKGFPDARFLAFAFEAGLTVRQTKDEKKSIFKCDDPGIYPVAYIYVFGRQKTAKQWTQLGKFPGDSVVEPGSAYSGRDRWFAKDAQANCPQSDRHFRRSSPICLTSLLGEDWPEVHVWVDHLASTGVKRNTYRWDGAAYQLLDESYARIDKYLGHAVFISPLQASDETWRKALGGVRVWNKQSAKFEYSEAFTKAFLKPKVVKSINGTAGLSPGFYCRGTLAGEGYDSECVELVSTP